MIPLLIGISLVTFFVIRLAPGGPLGIDTELNPKISLEAKERLKKLYRYDRPVWEQYAYWVTRMAKFDFGQSYQDGMPVIDKIKKPALITLSINILVMLVIFIVAIPLGVVSALKVGGWTDRLITIFVFIFFAMPTFWLALILMSFFGVRFHLLPVSGLYSLDFEYMSIFEKTFDVARHLVLPVFVSAITGLAGISRFMRTGMLEVINQEYIKTAWSKGLNSRTVIYKHALRNALLPIVTILGLSVPGLLGGSVIFEQIFSIPGMGRLFYGSVMTRDLEVVMGILMIGALLTLLGNFIADLAYAAVDPRIRLGRKE